MADTLGVLDNHLLFTVVARYQNVWVRNYGDSTGDEDTPSRFTDDRWMPTYGVVYKPIEDVSL